MRYRKTALGVGLFVLCVVVGAFIPVGGGSAVVIGGVVGLLLCYLVLSQKRFWSNASGAGEGSGEVNEKALREKTPSINEATANTSMIIDRLKHPNG